MTIIRSKKASKNETTGQKRLCLDISAGIPSIAVLASPPLLELDRPRQLAFAVVWVWTVAGEKLVPAGGFAVVKAGNAASTDWEDLPGAVWLGSWHLRCPFSKVVGSM